MLCFSRNQPGIIAVGTSTYSMNKHPLQRRESHNSGFLKVQIMAYGKPLGPVTLKGGLDPSTIFGGNFSDILVESSDSTMEVVKIMLGDIKLENVEAVSLEFLQAEMGLSFSEVLRVHIKKDKGSKETATRKDVTTVLMSNAAKVRYLDCTMHVEFPALPIKENVTEVHDNSTSLKKLENSTAQIQTQCLLKSALYQMGIGYIGFDGKEKLQKFVVLFADHLCFVQKHWKPLLLVDFPLIPKAYESSTSLQVLSLVHQE